MLGIPDNLLKTMMRHTYMYDPSTIKFLLKLTRLALICGDLLFRLAYNLN